MTRALVLLGLVLSLGVPAIYVVSAERQVAATRAEVEALVGSEVQTPPCPTCGSSAVARNPVVRIAVHARKGPRGRVIDLSSHACPGPGRPKHT